MKLIISLFEIKFRRDTRKAENRVTKPPIDNICIQVCTMSNIRYILRIGYNVDMDMFLFVATPFVIVVLLAMWMFKNV